MEEDDEDMRADFDGFLAEKRLAFVEASDVPVKATGHTRREWGLEGAFFFRSEDH